MEVVVPLMMKVVKVVVMVMVVVQVVMVAVADDDKVLAVPADIVDARHGERHVARVREPRVRLQLQLFPVHAGRLRVPYGRAVEMEHPERLEARKLARIFVLCVMSKVPRQHKKRRESVERKK